MVAYTGGVAWEAERRELWRGSGLDYGTQNETWVLNFRVTCELVSDTILMPHPEALGVGPDTWVLTSLPRDSDRH